MQRRFLLWGLVGLFVLCGAIFLFRPADKEKEKGEGGLRAPLSAASVPKSLAPAAPGVTLKSVPGLAAGPTPKPTSAATARAAAKRPPFQLANTTNTLDQLIHNDKAIILANALIDTSLPVDLAIPKGLRAPANNGTYLVQANGAVDGRFRAMLQNANATIISSIPNNAYLVRVSDAGAAQLSGNPQTQSVLPFEPYYKLDPTLLQTAIQQTPLPPNTAVSVTVFPDARDATLAALEKLGADVVGEDRSPFGPVFEIHPAANTLDQVASLPGVHVMGMLRTRVPANDLLRPRIGVAIDSVVATNYLGLTGSNVVVEINDTGVDATHPDLTGRVFGDFGGSLLDFAGHGTHVAGTILGNGSKSSTVTNAIGSVTNANFRGIATNATAFSVSIIDAPLGPYYNQAIGIGGTLGRGVLTSASDSYLQEQPALTNALISNNSWSYAGSRLYDIAAASYDAAVRDALPGVPGSQPVLFVFSAGDGGGGNSDGTGGSYDSISSPATAKNVITVGAIEQPRGVTNDVVVDGSTNQNFLPDTDSTNEVASFSGRGAVGAGIEGPFGRFKPDVVAPGTMVISDASTQWDTNAYYNITNYNYYYFHNLTASSNILTQIPFPEQGHPIGLILTVLPNKSSPDPFPTNSVPIYGVLDDTPTTNDFLGYNQITLPTNGLALNVGDTIFFGIGQGTNRAMNFDVEIELISTNDVGDYYTVLTEMNSGVGPWYRYESGTSMAAAGVSGMLACMQEFFESRQLTNSPALMKALVINGARSVNQIYDMSLSTGVLPQGWGLVDLSNSIPPQLKTLTSSGIGANATSLPLLFVDQSPSNSLATGQSQTYAVTLTTNGTAQPLRITLVWTDPPGDPVAGTKLVNNLVLVVTNTDTGEVFFGNDIPGGSSFNQPWATNGPPNIDLVNNVQNVYLSPPPGPNYTVTVLAERVNVNAITANTNNVVQDYALVISSGDGGTVPNPFTVFTPGLVTSPAGLNPVLTNIVAVPMVLSNAVPLFNQRVGANPSMANDTVGIGGGLTLTTGVTNQWNFYIYQNTAAATNGSFKYVAFVTFFPPELAVPGMEANLEVDPNSTNATRYLGGADIDLYVSTDPSLTNLNATALLNAQKSLNQGGNEVITYTNSTANETYYIAVKSEDQQGGQFDLVGLASDRPFSQQNTNGDVTVTLMPVPAVIPPGSPTVPGTNFLFGIVTQPIQIRKVVVTNTVTAQEFGDYVGLLTYGQAFVVLNNHSFFTNALDATETFFYDDMGDNQYPTARHTDGPGTLQSFVGKDGLKSGAWIFSMVNDSSGSDFGQIDNLSLFVQHQPPVTNGFFATIPAQGWYYGFLDVPATATNMIFYVSQSTPPLAVDFYVRQGTFPTTQIYDEFEVIQPGLTNALSISEFDDPPLAPVRYYFGLYNPNSAAVTVYVIVDMQLNLSPEPQSWLVSTNTPTIISDDAVTYSTIDVPVHEAIAGASVGVRINHSRESDLAVTLISPLGTRVLLAEDRGGVDTNGYGGGVNITNVFPQTASGGIASSTNNVAITNGTGTMIISYNFFTVPDDMRIYYGGALIYDTGLISGAGSFTVNYGPGSATNISVIMNYPGTNPNSSGTSGDEWNYSLTVIEQQMTYAIFTDDTNKAFIPIKFAVPPFGADSGGSGRVFSDFEQSVAGDYSAPTIVDGWSVLSNEVTVISTPPPANNGTNFLALRDGSIRYSLNTVAGAAYTMQFFESRAVPLDPIHWWPGNSSPRDVASVNPQDGLWFPLGAESYAPGEVDAAFYFAPTSNNYVKIAANPTLDIGTAPGFTLDCWVNPATFASEPIIQWYDGTGARLGVNLWLLTNSANILSLYADVIDNNGVDHVLNSPRGAITPGIFQHVALTYSVTNGVVLYINGAGVRTNSTYTNFVPQTSSAFDLYFGKDIPTGYRFVGLIDEVGLYNQALTPAQILDLYQAGGLGRCGTLTPPSVCPAPMANVLIGGTNAGLIIANSTNWTAVPINFTAQSANTTVEIDYSNNTSGVQLDTFSVTVPGQNNYFIPEEPLAKLLGQNAKGTWALEIMDSRAGPPPATGSSNAFELVGWELNFTYNNSTPAAFPLVDAVARTNFVPPNGVLYYSVAVPPWAQFATNTIFNVTGGTVSLLFNQNYLPGTNGAAFGDYTLLPGVSTSGTDILSTNSAPNPVLIPNATYFLAVTNLSPNVVSFAIDINFNLIVLTNDVMFTNTIPGVGIPQYQYYSYTVTNTNAIAVAFQVLQPDGNVVLVARHTPPLPDLNNFDYISANPGVQNQSIVVISNSTPVPLTPGTWYIGVENSSTNAVDYIIEATETDAPSEPTFITLLNDVPYTFTSGAPPGVDLTTFFVFNINNSPSAALFQLYNLSNNVDLTLQFRQPPYTTPYFSGSFSPGTNNEQIVIRTNILGTNINGAWYLGVPNNALTNVPYTIRAVLPNSSGLLISEFPLDLSIVNPGNNSTTNRTTLKWQSVNGETYDVLSTTNLMPPIVWTTNVVIATGQITTYSDTNAIIGTVGRYYEVIQVPGGP